MKFLFIVFCEIISSPEVASEIEIEEEYQCTFLFN